MQVGYCQGMAFVTGVILMYVPEEPAFRLLTRLMDENGANLRLLYLPGLEGLKNYLRMFEWLLDQSLPHLRAHLEARTTPCPTPAIHVLALVSIPQGCSLRLVWGESSVSGSPPRHAMY